MQYSFLGFSVSKMMELDLDVKDIIILRYFVDFKDSGRMSTEVIDGENYYWINYKSMEDNMPHLSLGKRAIMTRMLKLRDMGILKHYTKKEGGTFSFFALGDKYNNLIDKDFKKEVKEKSSLETVIEKVQVRDAIVEKSKVRENDIEDSLKHVYGVFEKEERVSSKNVKGVL